MDVSRETPDVTTKPTRYDLAYMPVGYRGKRDAKEAE